MNRTHLLLALAGLLTTAALSGNVTPPAPSALPPALVKEPIVTPPPGPLDGVYFLGGGHTLTLSRGRFVLQNHGASPEVLRGRAEVKGSELTLRSGLLAVQCQWRLAEGHLVVNDDDACRLLRGVRPFTPKAPPGRIDLGEVGVTPFMGSSGVGFWLDERDQELEVSAAPEPVRQRYTDTEDSTTLHWDPDELGLVVEFLPMGHVMNHLDTDLRVFWVMTGPDTAKWISTGGCNAFEGDLFKRSFRRVTRAGYEAAVQRRLSAVTKASPQPSTPPLE